MSVINDDLHFKSVFKHLCRYFKFVTNSQATQMNDSHKDNAGEHLYIHLVITEFFLPLYSL